MSLSQDFIFIYPQIHKHNIVNHMTLFIVDECICLTHSKCLGVVHVYQLLVWTVFNEYHIIYHAIYM